MKHQLFALIVSTLAFSCGVQAATVLPDASANVAYDFFFYNSSEDVSENISQTNSAVSLHNSKSVGVKSLFFGGVADPAGNFDIPEPHNGLPFVYATAQASGDDFGRVRGGSALTYFFSVNGPQDRELSIDIAMVTRASSPDRFAYSQAEYYIQKVGSFNQLVSGRRSCGTERDGPCSGDPCLC